MLRLIHSQTGLGGILIDDIDDGLPNKAVHRMGSTADPDSYQRDGYANRRKQPCYIPYSNPANTAQAGYIDLDETNSVVRSAGSGKIAGFLAAGLISVVSLSASDKLAPVVSTVTLDSPTAGDVTIAGSNFLSVLPDVTSVTLAGAGVGSVTLTKTQIEAASPGSVSNTSIVIDATLIAGLQAGDTVIVHADSQDSNTAYVPAAISGITQNSPSSGDITIAGLGFVSTSPAVTSVHLVGSGVGDVTLTESQITAVPPGAVGDTSIVIDSTLIPGLTGGDTVVVTSDGTPSNTYYLPAVITSATLDSPTAGDVTIDGIGFASTTPGGTSVLLTGAVAGSPLTLTETAITGGGGTVSDTQIVIPAALVSSLGGGDTIVVISDSQNSNTYNLAAVITGAALAGGDLTIDGVGLASTGPATTSVTVTIGGVPTTLSEATITGTPPGAVSNTQIIIDATLIPAMGAGDSFVVTADGVDSLEYTLPEITAAAMDSPGAGDLTIDGIGFSTTPVSVVLTGAIAGSPVTLTSAAIISGGGSVSDTQIVIDSSDLTGLAGGDTVVVSAGGQDSNTWNLAPVVTAAVVGSPGGGDITIDGAGLDGAGSSVRLFGSGVGDVTRTKAQILGAGGVAAYGDAQVIIPAALVPFLAAGDEVTVSADSTTSDPFTVTT
jgi:hypothetical protein